MGASLGLVDTTAVAHALGQFNSRIHQGRISDGIFLLDVCVRLHDSIRIVAREHVNVVSTSTSIFSGRCFQNLCTV